MGQYFAICSPVLVRQCGSDNVEATLFILRWLRPVLHFLEPLNFTKGFLAHHDGLLPVLAKW